MDNPWNRLPKKRPYVLDCDSSTIGAFNDHISGRGEYEIHTDLFPEPFVGNPAAPVYILGLNPGCSEFDKEWHDSPDFADAARKNLSHKLKKFPFFFLDPRFKGAPGAIWWRRRLRRLLGNCSDAHVSQSVFCVEIFPYHSRKFKVFPKRVSASPFLPSSQYAAFLVREALKEKKTIVVMRSFKLWCALVPELKHSRLVHLVKNPQNPTLSPGNLPKFKAIKGALESK